jgi:hypothetical protein
MSARRTQNQSICRHKVIREVMQMYAIRLAVLLVVLWYVLRGLARWFLPARRLMEKGEPWTRKLHAWVLSAPATFAYMGMFSATTLIQATAPNRLIFLLTTMQSTSLTRLRKHPLQALVDSGLWVADQGSGLITYLVVFGVAIAWAERRYGTPRIIVIGLSGHVFGSLLTAVLKKWAIASERQPRWLAVATDVGVSYVMVGCCGAALLVAHGWWRWVLAVGLFLAVALPVILSHTIWDWGHLLATCCGAAAAGLLRLIGPLRPVPELEAALPAPTPRRRKAVAAA